VFVEFLVFGKGTIEPCTCERVEGKAKRRSVDCRS
jgi:hypothetical protein